MTTFRENPDGEENQEATKQAERERFAMKMEAIERCKYCGFEQCECCDADVSADMGAKG